jgi:Holliday junction DNA helicase RuvB
MIEEEKSSFSELYEKENLTDQENIVTLRPKELSDYVGQDRVVEALKIAIEAALQRQEPLEHIIFNGPPGLGKTTLAHIVAHEMGTRIITSSGPALEKGGDLMGLLTHLEKGDIFFIDEIPRKGC